MKTTILAITILSPLFVVAQAHTEVHPTTPRNQNLDFVIGDTLRKSTSDVYNTLVENAPATPQNQDLPKFSIIGKENKFYLSVGAQFKSTVNYDWGNPLSSPSSFTPSQILPVAHGNGGKVDFTAQESRISFNFVGLPDTENQLGVYIAMKFNGDNGNYGVKINHAYAKYHGFTVGYTSTLFCDQTAVPYTIDAEAPNSTADFSNTVISYEHTTGKMKFGAGVEKPIEDITNGFYAASINQRIPDIPLYLQYGWGANSHIRFSTIFRNLQYHNEIADKNENVFGWGVKLSGTLQHNGFTFYYMGTYGKGIASYIEDNSSQHLDLVPDNAEKGKLVANKSWGGFGAVQYNFTRSLFCTAMYSHVRNYTSNYTGGAILYDDNYRYGQYVAANLIWSPNKYIRTGIEYLWGRRVNFNDLKTHNNRIMAMFSVSL